MGKEIERKFLIDISSVGKLGSGMQIKQGYIPTKDNATVRIRISNNTAFLTLKGENRGATRSEFEYEIPLSDAHEIIAELCKGPVIDKTRHVVEFAKHTWEIDVFHGDNEGLIIAEVEVENESDEIEMPSWVIAEVTGEEKYYNSSLLDNPFKLWV